MTYLLGQTEASMASALDDLGSAPYWVLGAYLVLLLTLGVIGWLRSADGEEDYYLAGREQGWVVSSLTIMATFFSSFAMLGAPGMVYREGVVFALFSLNVPVGGLCVYLIGSRIWKLGRAFGYVTPGDMVADYYGGRVGLRLLVALAGVLYAIPYVVMQIQAGGLISQQLFGENSFTAGAIALAAITMLYIMIGGMRSVAWTDVIQGVFLMSGMLVAGAAMLLLFGGPGEYSAAMAGLPASSLTAPGNTGVWAWPMVLTVCLFASSGSMIQPAQWMRYFAASNARGLRKAALIFALVLTFCYLFGVMLIGLAGQALYPLRFEYAAVMEGAAPEQTAALVEAAASAEALPAAFQVDAQSGDAPVLRWKWSGDERPAWNDEARRPLAALSDAPAFQAALEQLGKNAADPAARPAVAPHPDVSTESAFDAILVVVLTKNMPAVLGGFGAIFASLLIVSIMAASMSTADSNLHAMSAVLTRDVYDQYIRPNAGERERVWLGRAVIVVATLLALAIVIGGRRPEVANGPFDVLSMIAQMGFLAIAFSGQLLPIVFDMLFIRRGTAAGATVGLAAGLAAVFLSGQLFAMVVEGLGRPDALVAVSRVVQALKFTPLDGAVWGLAVNVPLFVVVSWLTRSRPASRRDDYAAVLERGSAK